MEAELLQAIRELRETVGGLQETVGRNTAAIDRLTGRVTKLDGTMERVRIRLASKLDAGEMTEFIASTNRRLDVLEAR